MKRQGKVGHVSTVVCNLEIIKSLKNKMFLTAVVQCQPQLNWEIQPFMVEGILTRKIIFPHMLNHAIQFGALKTPMDPQQTPPPPKSQPRFRFPRGRRPWPAGLRPRRFLARERLGELERLSSEAMAAKPGLL